MFNWIDPSFPQFFLVNILGRLLLFALVIAFGAVAVVSMKEKNLTGMIAGGIPVLAISILGKASLALFNGYSVYLLLTQDRVRDFWFWVLLVCYALALVKHLFPNKSTTKNND